MKILKFSYEFPPIGGGGSAVVHGLARQLVALGHEVEIVTMGLDDLPPHEIVDGIRVHRIACGRKYRAKCRARVAARYLYAMQPTVHGLLADQDYDVLHAHFVFPDGIMMRHAAGRARKPYVVTAHGSDVPGYNAKSFFTLSHAVLRPLWKRVAGEAGALVLPSHTLARLVEPLRPDLPLRIIPNAIDTEHFRPAAKKDQILVATRLVERKGVQHLLRALAMDPPGWPVIVVGSGEYEVELRRLNEQLGRPARFVGWMNNKSPEFRELLQQSAVYALPSDFENAPISLLEAMAAGCAIITTRGHGCEETTGDTAELVTPGRVDPGRCAAEIRAALYRLTRDAARRERLGESARRRVLEHYSWDAAVRRYLDVYQSAGERHAPSRAGS